MLLKATIKYVFFNFHPIFIHHLQQITVSSGTNGDWVHVWDMVHVLNRDAAFFYLNVCTFLYESCKCI